MPWALPLQGPSPSSGSCRGASGSPRTEPHLFATWHSRGAPGAGREGLARPPLGFLCSPPGGSWGRVLFSYPTPRPRNEHMAETGPVQLCVCPPRSVPAGSAELSTSSLPGEPGGQGGRGGQRRGAPARDAARLPRRRAPAAKGTVPGAPHQARLLGPRGSASPLPTLSAGPPAKTANHPGCSPWPWAPGALPQVLR